MSRPIEHLNHLASRAVGSDMQPQSMDLWVPSEQVLVFEVDLPQVSKRKLQEMLPWMLEERLLSPPDTFEFILGPQMQGSVGLVYVIAKSVMAQWIMVAESAAVLPECMAPDFMALPYEEGSWAVYADEGRLLVRTGAYTGFASDIEFGWQQLELLMAQSEEPVRFSSLLAENVEVPDFFADKLEAQRGQISWCFSELPQAVNLLPTRLKPKKTNALRNWVPAMASFGVFVFLILSYMLLQSWLWQRDIVVLDQGVAIAYESLFSEKLSVPSADAVEQAELKLSLMEHQYIGLQNSPMAELTALDRILSTCADCGLMEVSQSRQQLSLSLKQSPQLIARLEGLEGWQASWGNANEQGMSRLMLERSK